MVRRLMLPGLLLLVFACVYAPAQEPAETAPETKEQVVITGGVTYNPVKNPDEERMRDPFKSPFDLEKERQEAAKNTPRSDVLADRLEHMISELTLKGVYLEARTGYWAIFAIGGGSSGEYKWFQAGTKFQDGDLVNVTDKAVFFKQFFDDQSQDLAHREIVLELRRSEE